MKGAYRFMAHGHDPYYDDESPLLNGLLFETP
jgi:hypothetical protein